MADRCGICRGSEFVDAIDSNGHPYRGCARCSVAASRRWAMRTASRYTLAMGPVEIRVVRADGDLWMFGAWLRGQTGSPVRIACDESDKGAQLAQCQADAIAAVERWRDGIR